MAFFISAFISHRDKGFLLCFHLFFFFFLRGMPRIIRTYRNAWCIHLLQEFLDFDIILVSHYLHMILIPYNSCLVACVSIQVSSAPCLLKSYQELFKVEINLSDSGLTSLVEWRYDLSRFSSSRQSWVFDFTKVLITLMNFQNLSVFCFLISKLIIWKGIFIIL